MAILVKLTSSGQTGNETQDGIEKDRCPLSTKDKLNAPIERHFMLFCKSCQAKKKTASSLCSLAFYYKTSKHLEMIWGSDIMCLDENSKSISHVL